MRGITVALVLVIVALPARAVNPGDGSPPGSSDYLRAQASQYSAHMMTVLNFVRDNYVRPVERAVLAEAALQGLYEAARVPMPASLRAELARASADSQFSHLLAVARERLGDLEALRDQKALYASLRSLPRALDSYCGLTSPSERRVSYGEPMHGIGVEFESLPGGLQQHPSGDPFDRRAAPENAIARGPARIASVFPGSPAQRAGLRVGDVVAQLDDHPLGSPEGARLFPQLFGEAEQEQESLKLSFQRPGRDGLLHCRVMPASFRPESVFGVRRRIENDWDFMLDRPNLIGYLRLGFIDEHSDDEMMDAINSLKAAGMRALVFDLRGCPGGFVEPAKSISGMFVKNGLVATIHDRREGDSVFRIEGGSGILEGILTIVLIDAETRGGGEMIAAVLQDHKVARVAGQRSYGKGSVQRTETISGLELQYKLTTGSFTRPSGKNLHRFPDSTLNDDWGIRPDRGLEYPLTPGLSQRLKEWMNQQVLRPGDSREPLPLDDPENDPLRAFARNELLKQLK